MVSPIRSLCTAGAAPTIFALASPALASQATAVKCKDGTTSASSGRGGCSGHGGVKGAAATSKATGVPIAAPATAAAPKKTVYTKPITPPAPHATSVAGSGGGEDKNPAGAIAQCKDGMYTHAKNRTGACSRHGGVKKWM